MQDYFIKNMLPFYAATFDQALCKTGLHSHWHINQNKEFVIYYSSGILILISYKYLHRQQMHSDILINNSKCYYKML